MPSESVLWPRVIGQSRVKRILLQAVRSGRLPHAYLFYGNEGVGKDATALELARILHCEREGEEACDACGSCASMDLLQHPDVKFVTALPVGKNEKAADAPLLRLSEADVHSIQEQLKLKANNPYHRITIPRANIIKINSIREVRREASMSTHDRKRRVIIISEADQMGDEASNTILKTLEEPSGNTMLILTTAKREALLPTIVSRCQGVRFDPLTEEEIAQALSAHPDVEPEQAMLAARLANGSYVRALEMLQEDMNAQRQDVLTFIRHILGQNVMTIHEHIDRHAETRDRDAVLRFLTLLLMWFRDALVLSRGGEIINADQREDIRRFVDRFPGADLVEVVRDVERAVSLVERNVYIKLILLQLVVTLRSRILMSPAAQVTQAATNPDG